MTSQIQRGLTHSYMITYQMVCFFFTLFAFFFYHDGSVAHIFAHTCTHTQTDICYRPQRRGGRAFKRDAACWQLQLSGLNILLQDYGRGLLRADWHQDAPSPLSATPPPQKKHSAGAESDKMSAPKREV